MSAITTQTIGKYTYIYLSDSKWDPIKRYSVNDKLKIGKIDPITKAPIFTQHFLTDLQDLPELMEKMKTRFPGANLEINNNLKEVLPDKPIGRYPGDCLPMGLTYFLHNIADQMGLLKLLKTSFPDKWQKIFTIASFLIYENKALMECDDFVKDNLTFPVGTLSSQRTSELLLDIKNKDFNKFLYLWHSGINENEYIAFDSTSIPTYSKINDLADYGKAKSNPELKQVNLCLLYGEKSRLPVFQTVYNGSLNDVSKILEVIKEFESIVGTSKILIVNDKGFYSKNNILELANNTDVKFLAAVPFSNNDANDILDIYLESDILASTSSIIYTNHESIRGDTQLRSWYGKNKFYTHIFFNCMKALEADIELKDDLKELRQLYLQDKLPKKYQDIFNKFFIINDSVSKKSKYHLLDNVEEIDKYLRHKGYLILISNHIKDTQEAYNLYINKDCVEKAFKQYKQNLGMKRLYTGNSKRFTNKAIVAFIALILNSHIHHIMSKKNIYRNYTLSKMLSEINRIHVFLDIDGKYYLKVLTKHQKEILDAFEIPLPNRYIINFFIKNTLSK
jgi:transposase